MAADLPMLYEPHYIPKQYVLDEVEPGDLLKPVGIGNWRKTHDLNSTIVVRTDDDYVDVGWLPPLCTPERLIEIRTQIRLMGEAENEANDNS